MCDIFVRNEFFKPVSIQRQITGKGVLMKKIFAVLLGGLTLFTAAAADKIPLPMLSFTCSVASTMIILYTWTAR